MFQTTEVPECYVRFLQILKYRTIWRPDSNILSSMDVGNFMTWKVLCMVCENRKRSGVGLLCSNFLRLRKTFPVSCSLVRIMLPPHPEKPFQVHTILAARNNEIEDLETEGPLNKNFRIARGGDRLMGILFECDLCQFRNIKDGDPIHGSSKVNYTLICIRQLILDAFRSQDTSTVSGNFRRLRRD